MAMADNPGFGLWGGLSQRMRAHLHKYGWLENDDAGSWLYMDGEVLMVEPGEVTDPLVAYIQARVEVRRVRRAREERAA